MRRVVVEVVGMVVVEHGLPPFLQSGLQTRRHGTGMQPRVTDGGAGHLGWCGKERGRKGWGREMKEGRRVSEW